MQNTDIVKNRLQALFRSQRLAVLSTNEQGQPYGNLVSFVATEDMKNLLFATTRSTRKFANLTTDSRVAMLIDSRTKNATNNL